jgi:hypothetical protein
MNKFIIININTKKPIFEYITDNKDNLLSYIKNGKLLMPIIKEPSYNIDKRSYKDEFISIEYPENKVYRSVKRNDIKEAMTFCINEMMLYHNNKPIPLFINGMVYKFDINTIYQSISVLSLMKTTNITDINGKILSVDKDIINTIISNINDRMTINQSTKDDIINTVNNTNTLDDLLSIDISEKWS